MENASKALIIAGAILISIMIIGIGIVVIQATQGVQDDTEKAIDQQALDTFNNKYTSYVGNNKRGSDVRTLITTIISNNATYEDYQIKFTFNGTSYEGQDMSAVLNTVGSTKRYNISVNMDKSGRVNEMVVNDVANSDT